MVSYYFSIAGQVVSLIGKPGRLDYCAGIFYAKRLQSKVVEGSKVENAYRPGLYSYLAGGWKGVKTPHIGERIMKAPGRLGRREMIS